MGVRSGTNPLESFIDDFYRSGTDGSMIFQQIPGQASGTKMVMHGEIGGGEVGFLVVEVVLIVVIL